MHPPTRWAKVVQEQSVSLESPARNRRSRASPVEPKKTPAGSVPRACRSRALTRGFGIVSNRQNPPEHQRDNDFVSATTRRPGGIGRRKSRPEIQAFDRWRGFYCSMKTDLKAVLDGEFSMRVACAWSSLTLLAITRRRGRTWEAVDLALSHGTRGTGWSVAGPTAGRPRRE